MSEGPAVLNPYANYGSPVTGEQFVGRASYVRSIRSRTFASYETASATIVGPPRVGKSSLAQEVLDKFTAGTSGRGLAFLPMWITVSGLDTEQALFRELAYQAQVRLAELPAEAEGARSRLRPHYDALTAATAWDDMRMALKTYLRALRRAGYQAVAVLDEFDAARNIFDRAAPFELLRAIAYESEIRVALITTSRRPLPEIVVRSTAEVSTFWQVFGLPETLGCFGDAELTALIARSPYQDPDLRKALFEWLSEETGGQPFLSSALLSILHDRWSAGEPPGSIGEAEEHFGDAVAACGPVVIDQHEQMLVLLREEGRLTKLLEVLFGPQETVGQQDAKRMASEGIIKETDDGWAAFSKSFHQYLSLLENARTSDNWKLWERTETALRAALTAALDGAYGDLWPVKLKESQAGLVNNCESRREHAARAFPDLAWDENLLDYTYPKDLLDIMMMHWDQVAPVFGQDKGDWRSRIELVSKMRTPMAHNRRAGTSPLRMEQFRSACQEILDWLPVPAA